jgi:hypothetical protein
MSAPHRSIMFAENEDLTREDLEFLQRAESLKNSYAKIKKAKALIAEARAEIAVAMGGKAPPAVAGKKGKGKAPPLSFAVGGPDELTADERRVLDLIKSGVSKKPELVEKTKINDYTLTKILKALLKRKLVKTHGATAGKTWEIK